MRRWTIWTGTAVILLAILLGFFTVKTSANQTILLNMGDLQKQWKNTNTINLKNIGKVLQSMQKSDKVMNISTFVPNNKGARQGFSGELEVQVTLKKELNEKETLQASREMMDLFFSNQKVKRLTVVIHDSKEPDRNYIFVTTDRKTFLNK